jgi:hypothetical protein
VCESERADDASVFGEVVAPCLALLERVRYARPGSERIRDRVEKELNNVALTLEWHAREEGRSCDQKMKRATSCRRDFTNT